MKGFLFGVMANDNSTMYINLRQNLIETIADWLDSQTVSIEQCLANIDDNDDDLHIKMAEAAIAVYAESRGLVFIS